MGDIQGKGGDDEKPVYEVTVDKFMMGQYEVTLGEFKQFVEQSSHEVKGGDFCNWQEGRFAENDEQPVQCINWNDAIAYTQWLSKQTGKQYRLPTEAEWEYAARAGSDTLYTFGNDEKQLKDYAWYEGNSGNKTHPVGQKRPNQWNLYDMHGNVYEWVQDWYDENYYANSPENHPRGAEKGSSRVIRGGSWFSTAINLRSANRLNGHPSNRLNYLGFRLTRTVP